MEERKTVATQQRPRAESPQAVNGAGLEQRFEDLVRQWKDAVRASWSVRDMVNHEAYQSIIAMGAPAIPLILREMQQRPDHWFMALHLLTGIDPAAGEETGTGATNAWLRWGRRQGYIE